MPEDFKSILASSINRSEQFTAFDEMLKNRWDNLDITPLLMYFIDICPANALPFLAAQFDMMGFNGWGLTQSESERRELIKGAIELKRYRGTPWAITESLKRVGFAGVELQEGTGSELHNGVRTHNGAITHGSGFWANFRVSLLDLGETRGFSSDELNSIIEMIKRYKNTRSNLLDVILKANTEDDLIADDSDLEFNIQATEVDEMGVTRYHDGSFLHDGTQIHNANTDILTMSINYGDIEDSLPIVDEEISLTIIPSDSSKFILSEDGNYILSEDGARIITELEGIIIDF